MKHYNKLVILVLVLTLVALLSAQALAGARRYNNQYATWFAWDWGGVEYRGAPGLFICPAWRNADDSITPNPLAPFFPELLTDC